MATISTTGDGHHRQVRRRHWPIQTAFFTLPHLFWTSLAAPTITPAPISVQATQIWDGNDGPWSSFSLRVGQPVQHVRLFPSTAGQTTFVVLPSGCTANDSETCPEARGALFNPKNSTTWDDQGYYNLAFQSNLNYSGNGNYGYDSVGVGLEATGGPTLPDQVVAGIQTKQFFIGMFGLGPQPNNLSTFDNPKASFITTLKSNKLIPSLSWAYTAGAPYRLKKVYGSLTLGGHDTSRYTPNNLTFPFAPDTSRDLVVGLQAITATDAAGTNTSLLPSGVLSFIDSTVPHLWLPLEACRAFEKTLGLTYNEENRLYLVNDSLHDSLLASNYSFTFKLGNTRKGGSTIDINLPYAAFDLTVGPPLVPNNTRYFPIKRGDNDTQYTLGRTFLQEAYIIADYERQNFSLSQASFVDGAKQCLVAIPPPDASLSGANRTNHNPSPPPPHPHPIRLSIPVVMGIVAAAVILLALTAYLTFAHTTRRFPFRRRPAAVAVADKAKHESTAYSEADRKANVELSSSAAASGVPEMATHDFYGGKASGAGKRTVLGIGFQGGEVEARQTFELPAHELSEMDGASEPVELPGTNNALGRVAHQEMEGRGVSLRLEEEEYEHAKGHAGDEGTNKSADDGNLPRHYPGAI